MGMLADDIIKSKGAFFPDAIFLGVVIPIQQQRFWVHISLRSLVFTASNSLSEIMPFSFKAESLSSFEMGSSDFCCSLLHCL